MENPTEQAYSEMQSAYDYFNKALFGGELPYCLITMQRKNRALGYFSPDRFANSDGRTTDEIAMNPIHFANRCLPNILSTLVHEQVHLWQHHFGSQHSRGSYHNREWGTKMKAVGLYPSDTAMPGGKETGDSMSHYIIEGGAFDIACQEFLKGDFAISWNDVAILGLRKKKNTREKYTCSGCGNNVWGKPGLLIFCGDCNVEYSIVTG